jgi:hypothetical protein
VSRYQLLTLSRKASRAKEPVTWARGKARRTQGCPLTCPGGTPFLGRDRTGLGQQAALAPHVCPAPPAGDDLPGGPGHRGAITSKVS